VPYFFQHVNGKYHANTIRVDHASFEERLVLLGGAQSGGGEEEMLPESVFDDVEYAKYGDDLMYELSFANQLKRRIYMILFDTSKQPKHVLVPETKRIFDYLFRMFMYVGESTLNFTLLRKLLAAYALHGESLQHDAFASLYYVGGTNSKRHTYKQHRRTTTRRRARRHYTAGTANDS
jgi:hypothetical protein